MAGLIKNYTVQDLPSEERPRERLRKHGAQLLSVQELLQIILSKGVKGQSVSDTAQSLLNQFGNISNLSDASIEEISEIKGIGFAKACQIKAALEIGRRIRNPGVQFKPRDLTRPENVFQLMKSELKDFKKEHFYLICLNTRNYMVNLITIGLINSSLVHPREVFAEAIRSRAVSVILVHNHPSGNLNPSNADFDTTQILVKAGKLLQIEVSDHVIISKTDYYSFREHGLL